MVYLYRRRGRQWHGMTTLKCRTYTGMLLFQMDVMVVKTAYLVPFLSVVLVAYAAREQDRIVHLLGFNQDLNFKQYSGFLETGSGKYLHYWYIIIMVILYVISITSSRYSLPHSFSTS